MFKAMSLTALLLASTSSFAQESSTALECKVSMALPGEEAKEMTFRVVNADGTQKAFVDQKVSTEVFSIPSSLTVTTEQVRSGLSAFTSPDDLNSAEKIVVHAMLLEAMPELASFMSSGVELSKIRSARVYMFGEATNMGSTSVVEALDQDGNLLGSFLGGFMVSPCL